MSWRLSAVVLLVALAACPGSVPPPAQPAPSDPEVVPSTKGAGAEPAEPPAEVEPAPGGDDVVEAGTLAAGEACKQAEECKSGVCEGEGCDVGVCAPERRACTRDLRPYCGCDGQTFRTSGNCPGRLYAHRGDCTSQ